MSAPLRTLGSRRPRIVALALAGAIIAAPAAAAAFTTSHPHGGTWTHGVSDGTVLSAYQHPSRVHRASVETDRVYRSSCAGPGALAGISARARPFAVDHAYYAFC